MPTGLRNVVCDECPGGRMAYLGTGELQLEHQPGCFYKWREDTFLIDLAQQLFEKNPDGPNAVGKYPGTKLNPIIYDLLCDGYFTEYRNKTFANGNSKAEKRAKKVNDNLQLVREAMIKDGTWPLLPKNLATFKT